MKRKHRLLAIGASALLLIALCVPALSGALAAGQETPLVVPIGQETAVFGADGTQIGVVGQNAESGTVLQLTTGEAFAGIQVIFDQAAANKAEKTEALAGKTLVLFRIVSATAAPETTPETTPDETPSPMPTEGWIDANLIVTALAARHAADTSKIMTKDAELASLRKAVADAASADEQDSSAPADETPAGIFSAEKMDIWVPVAAIAIGLFALGLLAWLAISTATTAWDTESQTKLLLKINDQLAAGIEAISPLHVEQIAWPREGHVKLTPDVVEHLAAANRNKGNKEYMQEPKKPVVVEPEPIPEGEEPDLLQLANRLAGRASAAEWHEIVKEAGLKAVLLQANPTEKGTFVADESGYSIIACLMRSPDAEIGYVLPSYQDPNASERRWMEFYSVNENNSVRNYRVDALAVVHIERGTFFLPKSYGRLTRRQQQF